MELKQVEKVVAEMMANFDAKSLSVSVWDGKQELHAAAGMADEERGIAAGPDVYYAIGSSTKAFTGASICILADQGKLELDQPVKKYLPWFKMADSYVQEHLTVRDMLCHRCGLPRHDAMLELRGDATLRQAVEAIAWLRPAHPFRYTYHYQNHMFMLASVLIEEISGQSYEAFVSEHILKPLHMDSSFVYGDEIPDDDTRKSCPYDGRNHVFHRVPRDYLRMAAGAGSMYSTTRDMLKWLRFQLHGDERILSHKLRLEAQSPQMLSPIDPETRKAVPEIISSAYAFGWGVATYRGVLVCQHAGGLDGYRALHIFAPGRDLGVSVLINCNADDGVFAVGRTLLDLLLDAPDGDWNRRLKEMVAAQRSQFEAAAAEMAELRRSAAAVPEAEKLTGAYHDPGYGTVRLVAQEGALHMVVPRLRLPLLWKGEDRFDVLYEPECSVFPGKVIRDGRGAVTGIDVAFEPTLPHDPIHFTRAAR